MIIAVMHLKGGIGKSTTTVNLGHALAAAGHRTLLLDMDAQAQTSAWIGALNLNSEDYLSASVATLLLEIAQNGPAAIDRRRVSQAIRPTRYDDLHILPTDWMMSRVETAFRAYRGDTHDSLRRTLTHVASDYAFILIDCPPGYNSTSQAMALTACDAVIVPVIAQGANKRPTADTIEFVHAIARERDRTEIPILGIYICSYDTEYTYPHQFITDLRSTYGRLVFESTTRRSGMMGPLPEMQRTILDYRPRSPASESYRRLAAEVLGRTHTKKRISTASHAK